MKRNLWTLVAVTLVVAVAFPSFAAPAKDNANQDFTGTPVDVAAPASVMVGDAASVTISIKNVADRGLPQVTIFVNGVQKASFDEIAKGATKSFTFNVDTAAAGAQSFEIVVWTRKGNKNFEDILYSETTTITVVAPVAEKPMEEKFNDAIKNGEVSGTGPIVITVDGVAHEFVSNSGNYNGNGSLFCWVDGVEYRLERNKNGLIGVFVN